MHINSKKTTPPLSSRTFLNYGSPTNASANQYHVYNRGDHQLSISPWYNEDTNLNRMQENSSNKKAIQLTNKKMRVITTTRKDKKISPKVVSRWEVPQGRCLTQNIYVDTTGQLTGRDQSGNQDQSANTFRLNNLEIFTKINQSRADHASYSLKKYNTEEISQRKMSMNKFRSPTPIHEQIRASKTTEIKVSKPNIKSSRVVATSHQHSRRLKSQSTEDLRNQGKTYVDFQHTKVLIERKLHMGSQPFQPLSAMRKTEQINRMKGMIYPAPYCCSQFIIPRQKNNIMTRERNIMKLRNLMKKADGQIARPTRMRTQQSNRRKTGQTN